MILSAVVYMYLLRSTYYYYHYYYDVGSTFHSGKLIAVIGDEDTVTGFLLAGVGHRSTDGANFLVVKPGKKGWW